MESTINNREQRAIISRAVVRQQLDMLLKDQYSFMCRNLIQNKVFENGLELCVGDGKSCQVSTDMSTTRVLEDHWIPLAKKAVDLMFSIGVVPVRFIRQKGGIDIPYVPAVGTWDLHVITSPNGRRRYELFDNESKMDPVADCLILHGYGFDPMVDGSLTSLVSTLEPVARFIAELSDAAVTSERIRANPPVIIQKKDGQANREASETIDFDYYADTDNVQKKETNHFQRDETAMKQLNRQKKMFVGALYPSRAEENAQGALQNMVPLPSSFTVGTLLEPTSRTDFVTINRMTQETICSTLGVPRSLFINDNVVRGDQGKYKKSTIYHFNKI